MLKLDISIIGEPDLKRSLMRMQKNIDNRLPLMKRIGIALRRFYVKNMTKGVDPNGKALAPVARWTRQIGLGAGESRSNSKAIPLLNTGMLRNSMGTIEATKNGLEFGWKGLQLDKAYRMINGIAGMMMIKNKYIRQSKTKKSRYVRIKTDAGWFTKTVISNAIKVTSAKRNFFFLGKKQEREIVGLIDQWIDQAMAGQARSIA